MIPIENDEQQETTTTSATPKEKTRSIECLQCNKTFKSLRKLKIHRYKKHVKINICSKCNTVVLGKKSWIRHQAKHEEENSLLKMFFFCPFCSKQFKLLHAQENHVKAKHCAFCRKFFSNEENMIKHSFADHQNRYKCEKCHNSPVFVNICDAVEHEKIVHKCDFCHLNFFDSNNKTKHVKKCRERNATAAAATVAATTTEPAVVASANTVRHKEKQKDDPDWKTITLDDGFNYLINISSHRGTCHSYHIIIHSFTLLHRKSYLIRLNGMSFFANRQVK